MLCCAVISGDFHHRQRAASGDAWPRQWERNAAEKFAWRDAQRPRRFQRARRLTGERGARGEINVRIKPNRINERRAPEAAHFYGAPAAGPAEARIGIGEHIRWRGERQHQQPLEKAMSRKTAQADEPCGRRAEQNGAATADQHQCKGANRAIAQQLAAERCPFLLRRQRKADDGERRGCADKRRHRRRERDAVDGNAAARR